MELKNRIIEISKKYGLSHVGSSLSAVDIMDEFFPKGELVVSCGHAGIAYYVVREKYLLDDAEEMFKAFGVHCQMYGSLGHGLPITVGRALASPNKKFYCIISDGECMEGSIYESLRLANKLNLKNLHVCVNANGYGGLDQFNLDNLEKQLKSFGFPIDFRRTNMLPLKGLEAHYQRLE